MHLTAALTALPAAIEQQLKRDSGLNFFEYCVLAELSEAPDQAMQMCELAGLTLGSPSRLSHAVSRLERAGWVARRSQGDGSRTVQAVLTDTGRAKLAQAAPPHVREARRLVVDVLTADELSALGTSLRKVLAIVAPQALALVDHRRDDQPDDPTDRPDNTDCPAQDQPGNRNFTHP